MIASRLVFEVLQSHPPLLVQTKAMETATLLNALTAGLRAAVDGLVQFHHLPGAGGSCCERQQRRSTAANPSN
jgi:hypothetical protein